MKKQSQRRKPRAKKFSMTRRQSPAYSPVSPYHLPIDSFYPNVMSAVYAFREMTNELDFEICGTLQQKNINNWRLKIHNTRNSATGKRLSCVYNYHEPIILHNHPDKYYPSLEDIEKVVKNKPANIVIYKSFIVSKVGIWEITVSPELKLSESEIYKKRDDVNTALNNFYKDTERGRKYNAAAVRELCNKIHSIFGLNMEFINFL